MNLDCNQWLLNCCVDPDRLPCICLRHDVDGVVWQPTDDVSGTPWEHMATFNAFGFVLASKQSHRFVSCSPDFSYAAVADVSRYIYVFRQPTALASPLRNRKTGQVVAEKSDQQVITIESNERIVGMHTTTKHLFVLAGDVMYVYRIN